MRLEPSAAEVGLHKACQDVFAVPGDEQVPVNPCIGTSNALFRRHVGRESPFKQMCAAEPPFGSESRKGVVEQPCAK